ncbi:MAG TPA: phosphomannose isomerase type II C-terminal cupin domain [Candidatus Eisenbacteria bacterium]|jgi:mannose-6-phosphate isomerase-like protein (cupin superfamily)|nr:phosphomannose isomerase type II C-terminal cupin domain [Candidatus Eisenbacteria bacterium]
MPDSERPWGKYEVLYKGSDVQVKRIEVGPKMRFSLQKHMKRAETWVVASGRGIVTLDSRETPVSRGDVVEVAVGQVHRMQNTADEPLVFFEVQLGDYLGEDDIVRLEDDFKRA